jgi:filamentous hemagglutinin family protein
MKILTQKLAMFFVGLGMFFLPAQGIAIPQDPSFNAEHVGISQEGSSMVIEQHVDKAIIDWKDYSIDADELVQYIQPNADAIALNKITGANPSEIMGDLLANGQIFIINPNGILFGPNSHVNTAGLLATTLNISDADFLEGNYEFSQEQYKELAAIINKGEITISDNGYVVIVAPLVSNEGLIVANLGSVHVGAAERFTVNFDGRNLINFEITTPPEGSEPGTVLIPTGQVSDIIRQVVNYDGILDTIAEGSLITSGTIQAGNVGTSGRNVYIGDTTLVKTRTSQGVEGSWFIHSNNFTIADDNSNISKETLSSNLDLNNIKISSNGSDLLVKDTISWNANTLLGLKSSKNVVINDNLIATGDTAGIIIAAGKGDDGYRLSGMITLSGATPSLIIAGNTYTIIKDVNELQNMNNDLEGCYALGVDIDASATSSWNTEQGFSPIGHQKESGLAGKFDGLGHTIRDLYINLSGKANNVGLFSRASGSNVSIKNAGLINVDIEGSSYIGALVGHLEHGATIDNCYSTGTIKAHAFYNGNNYCDGGLLGGLVGLSSRSTISNSYTTGIICGEGNSIGGLIGNSSNSTINNSYATGSVTGKFFVGGLVGFSPGSSINNSYTTGIVTGDKFLGGLIGGLSKSNVNDSYAIGSVTGNEILGGLVGNCRGSAINNSYATGPVTGEKTTGGLVASCSEASVINNSYATGSVTGKAVLGGLVARCDKTSVISNSYAIGSVKGKEYIGGLVGSNGIYGRPCSNIINSFWDINKSGQSRSFGGTGKTTEEMKTKELFAKAGWDFDTTWKMSRDFDTIWEMSIDGYPVLQQQNN